MPGDLPTTPFRRSPQRVAAGWAGPWPSPTMIHCAACSMPTTTRCTDGVKLIPATELTGYDYERQHRVHLLAYWPDPGEPALRRHCDLMRQRAGTSAVCRAHGNRGHLSPVPHRTGAGIRQGQRRALQKAASCRRCGNWGLPIASTASATTCSAGTRGAFAPLARNISRCGGFWPRQAGCRGGARPPTVYKKYAAAPGAGQGGWWTASRSVTPATAPRQGRVLPPSVGSIYSITQHGASSQKRFSIPAPPTG